MAAASKAAKSITGAVGKGVAAAGGVLGGLDYAEGSGLDKAGAGLAQASSAAGDTLRGIFGGLPWDMVPSGIVEAVTGSAVPHLTDAVAVLV